MHLPVVDMVQRTLASSECPQLWLKLAGQSISLLSVDVHRTSSMTIGPAPAPNLANDMAVAATRPWHIIFTQRRKNYTVSVCTCWRVSKLSTDNSGIKCTPWIITNCTPLVIVADLHTTFKRIAASNKPEVSSGAVDIYQINLMTITKSTLA